MFVTGLVLAAEGSPRLGVPRQLLSYQGSTLLGASLETARECGFDQLLVTLGAASEQIRERVDLAGVRVVESPHADTGSASIVPALDAVDRRTDGLVVLRGDQPGVTSAEVWSLVAEAATPVGVTRYADGRSQPLWFARETFGSLRRLRSDHDLWDLVDTGRYPVTDIDAIGNIPRSVETWDDYEALVGHSASGPPDTFPVTHPAAVPTRGRAPLRRTRNGS